MLNKDHGQEGCGQSEYIGLQQFPSDNGVEESPPNIRRTEPDSGPEGFLIGLHTAGDP